VLAANFYSFVICNDGFTIERLIHGLDAAYNDINPWSFKDIVNVFGGTRVNAKTFQIKTKEQVNRLFEDEQFNAAGYLQFVELYVPKEDAPRALVLTAEASARTNAKE
jgi:pyruvate decarboxylase